MFAAKKSGFVIALAIALTVVGTGPAHADCSSVCAAGAAGTGGVSSDGKASGFREAGPSSRYPDTNFTNSGGANSGHISLSGATTGSASGAYTPQGVVVGHYTGQVALNFGMPGDCSGVCG